MRLSLLGLSLALILAASQNTYAHHSRANFILDEIVTIEGTVTEYSWRSPHVWMKIETIDGRGERVEWLVEGNAIPPLRKRGWTKESFEVGDHVVAAGNPDRDRERKLMFLESITADDGTVLYNLNLPPEQQAEIEERMKPTEASTDFGGMWVRIASTRYFLLGSFEPPKEWKLTDKGSAQIAEFDLANDPFLRCQATAFPRLTYAPFGHRWVRYDDRIEIEKEHNPNARTVYLDMQEHPADIEPSRVGHSIGWFEGDTLVVDTVGFVYDQWGGYRGLDSSEQKHVVERYTLTDDGFGMHMELTQTDPVFLTEPAVMEWDYQKQKNYEFEYVPCTVDSARRHLEETQ
jgi:hypothetical protein